MPEPAATPVPTARRSPLAGLRLYPAQPARRLRAIAADVAVVALLLVFAWVGTKVHDGVAELAELGRGVQTAGTAVTDAGRSTGGAVHDALGGAGRAVGGAPLVGGTLQGALEGAGSSAGGSIERAGADAGSSAVTAGRVGEQKALDLAVLLGWVTFLLPALILLSRVLPARIATVRRMSAAARVLAVPGRSPERDAILAQRAVYALPFSDLLRHTDDPVGDLLAGRHARLIAALEDAEGVSVGAAAHA